MKEKVVLFPFRFHFNGAPNQTSTEKFQRELQTGERVSSTVDKLNAGQIAILKNIKVSEDEIHQFANPIKWIEFFPPCGKSDLIDFDVVLLLQPPSINIFINLFDGSFES